MAKKIWTVTLADDLINSLRFDSANVLRRIIIGKGLNEAQSRQRWQAAVRPRNFLRGDENRKWRLERREGCASKRIDGSFCLHKTTSFRTS